MYNIAYSWPDKTFYVGTHPVSSKGGIHSFVKFKTNELADKFIELNTPLLKDFFMLND